MDGVKSGWNLVFFTGTEPDPVQNRDRTNYAFRKRNYRFSLFA